MGQNNYVNGFNLTLHEHMLELPLGWQKPRMVFVNSMSDLFHKDVSENFIQKVFSIMEKASWHTFQILTKRSDRLFEMDKYIDWQENVWMGVSVENNDYTFRIEHLRNTHSKIKFLSLEPLLSNLSNLNLSDIDWVIVGGESGPKARPMNPTWVMNIKDQCREYDVPFFFKQWGGKNKKKAGRLLNGRTWDELPRNVLIPI